MHNREDRWTDNATTSRQDMPKSGAEKTMFQIGVRARCLLCVLAATMAVAGGCCHLAGRAPRAIEAVYQLPKDTPRELAKVVLPPYTIEPPDILSIEAIHLIPKSPYHLRALDVLNVHVEGTVEEKPITGSYPVSPTGAIDLGFSYGSVNVVGLTVEEAGWAMEQHLRQYLKEPSVSASLLEVAAMQQITGEHLVNPDGTVTLGSYGSVPVVGMTIGGAKMTIESHLSQFLEDPEVAVDVFAYNSKVYYVITQGAGLGDGLYRFPITGNETVLDAISQINGLTEVSSKRLWIARPTPAPGQVQVLPVDWEGITAHAATDTNYQVLPGDRIFIEEDQMVALDTYVGKVVSPWERVMGFVTLGTNTAARLYGNVMTGGGLRGAFGGFGGL